MSTHEKLIGGAIITRIGLEVSLVMWIVLTSRSQAPQHAAMSIRAIVESGIRADIGSIGCVPCLESIPPVYKAQTVSVRRPHRSSNTPLRTRRNLPLSRVTLTSLEKLIALDR